MDALPSPTEILDEVNGKKLVFYRDQASGLRAVVAVHSTVDGHAAGGLRMKPYTSDAAAARDAARLAEAMALKYAAAGMRVGGAKAVIIGDASRDKTDALLKAFGRFVEGLRGEYCAGEDVGTDGDDMKVINQETNWLVSLPEDAGGPGDVSRTTAEGVLYAMRACCEHVWGRPTVRDRSVAVQGLGQVGLKLARMLVSDGAKVTVADVDDARVAAAVDELGVVSASPEAISTLPVDIFSPCALGDAVNEDNVAQIRAKVVAGSANNIFSSTAVADALERRGQVYAVDFIANAGGIIYDDQMLTLPRSGGFDEPRARAYVEGIFDRTLQVFEGARRDDVPLWQAALTLAQANLADQSDT
jgi:glutamate dehydrogenase/leucine dehydrogenase